MRQIAGKIEAHFTCSNFAESVAHGWGDAKRQQTVLRYWDIFVKCISVKIRIFLDAKSVYSAISVEITPNIICQQL